VGCGPERVPDAMDATAWPRQYEHAKEHGSGRCDESEHEQELESAFDHDSLPEGLRRPGSQYLIHGAVPGETVGTLPDFRR
jgi:hypothetical protein